MPELRNRWRAARANYHLDLPKDTEEEAAAVKQAIGDAPFLLVTSASHLPRAMIFSAGRVKSATSPGESVGHRLAA